MNARSGVTGRTYHSSRSARDRDRLRQEILEERGWELHRVWSTDWFHNSEYEVERLLERIRSCEHPRHPSRAVTSHLKLTAVVSDIVGVSGRAILDALIAGATDPERLVDLTSGRLSGRAQT